MLVARIEQEASAGLDDAAQAVPAEQCFQPLQICGQSAANGLSGPWSSVRATLL